MKKRIHNVLLLILLIVNIIFGIQRSTEVDTLTNHITSPEILGVWFRQAFFLFGECVSIIFFELAFDYIGKRFNKKTKIKSKNDSYIVMLDSIIILDIVLVVRRVLMYNPEKTYNIFEHFINSVWIVVIVDIFIFMGLIFIDSFVSKFESKKKKKKGK